MDLVPSHVLFDGVDSQWPIKMIGKRKKMEKKPSSMGIKWTKSTTMLQNHHYKRGIKHPMLPL